VSRTCDTLSNALDTSRERRLATHLLFRPHIVWIFSEICCRAVSVALPCYLCIVVLSVSLKEPEMSQASGYISH
jgi:hypothetical protein